MMWADEGWDVNPLRGPEWTGSHPLDPPPATRWFYPALCEVCGHHWEVVNTLQPCPEAQRFRELGANVFADVLGSQYDAEIYLDGLLDFVGEPDPADPEVVVHDVRARVVLQHFRERDGFGMPMQERWAAAEVAL